MNVEDLLSDLPCDVAQKGEAVFVYNEAGDILSTHKAMDLAIAFLTMSNDAFFVLYGFNFIPDGKYWKLAQAEINKKIARQMLHQRMQSMFPFAFVEQGKY